MNKQEAIRNLAECQYQLVQEMRSVEPDSMTVKQFDRIQGIWGTIGGVVEILFGQRIITDRQMIGGPEGLAAEGFRIVERDNTGPEEENHIPYEKLVFTRRSDAVLYAQTLTTKFGRRKTFMPRRYVPS